MDPQPPLVCFEQPQQWPNQPPAADLDPLDGASDSDDEDSDDEELEEDAGSVDPPSARPTSWGSSPRSTPRITNTSRRPTARRSSWSTRSATASGRSAASSASPRTATAVTIAEFGGNGNINNLKTMCPSELYLATFAKKPVVAHR